MGAPLRMTRPLAPRASAHAAGADLSGNKAPSFGERPTTATDNATAAPAAPTKAKRDNNRRRTKSSTASSAGRSAALERVAATTASSRQRVRQQGSQQKDGSYVEKKKLRRRRTSPRGVGHQGLHRKEGVVPKGTGKVDDIEDSNVSLGRFSPMLGISSDGDFRTTINGSSAATSRGHSRIIVSESPPTRLRWACDSKEDEQTKSGVHGGHVQGVDSTADEGSTLTTTRLLSGTDVRRDSGKGAMFQEVTRGLLSELEGMFVTMADDRRHGLVALRREEVMWKAAALRRARADLRQERSKAEERLRERVVDEGPGATALKAAGLVQQPQGCMGDAGDVQESPGEEAFRRHPRGRGWSLGWRLPPAVIEAMRSEFEQKLDRESAEILTAENKSLLEARAGLAEREGRRTERDLEELSHRLTNDGRDALAALQVKLDTEAEGKLAEEKAKLKEGLTCAMKAERYRLRTLRDLRMADARDENRREAIERATALTEKAKQCTERRESEAVRLLDEAAEKARRTLQALLQAQASKGLDEVRERFARDRKALMNGGWRDEEEQKCLDEIANLAHEAREKNEAWLHEARHEWRATPGDDGEWSHEDAQQRKSTLPALESRAIEAADECSRLGRRLVELVTKEACMQLESTRDWSVRADSGGLLDQRVTDEEQRQRRENDLAETPTSTKKRSGVSGSFSGGTTTNASAGSGSSFVSQGGNSGPVSAWSSGRPASRRQRKADTASVSTSRKGGCVTQNPVSTRSRNDAHSRSAPDAQSRSGREHVSRAASGNSDRCDATDSRDVNTKHWCGDCERLSCANAELKRILLNLPKRFVGTT